MLGVYRSTDPPDDYWDIYEAWCDENALDPEDDWQDVFLADMADLAADARAERARS